MIKNTVLNQISIVLFPTIFILLIISFTPMVWVENDNPVIGNIAFLGYPAPFIHILYSKFLSFAGANISADIAWFGLSLCLAHIISLSLFSNAFVSSYNWLLNKSKYLPVVVKIGAFFFYVAYIFIYAKSLIQLDFTATSILLGVNSILYILAKSVFEKLELKHIMLACVLIFCAIVIRLSSFHGIVAITLPGIFIVSIFSIFNSKGESLFKRYLSIPLSCLLILSFGFVVLKSDNMIRSYTDTAQEVEYRRYNAIRGKIHIVRYSAEFITEEQFHEADWTMADWRSISNWLFFDESRYSIERMERLNAQISSVPITDKITVSNIKKHFYKVMQHSIVFLPIFLGLIFIGLGFVFCFSKPKWRPILSLFTIIIPFYPLFIGAMTSLLLKLQYRLAHPIFLASLGILWITVIILLPRLLGAKEGKEEPQEKGSSLVYLRFLWVGTFMLIIGFAFNFKVFIFDRIENDNKLRLHHEIVEEINLNISNDTVLLVQPGSLGYERVHPLAAPNHNLKVIPLGWLTFSPYFYGALKDWLGISQGKEILSRGAETGQVIVIATEAWVSLLEDFSEDDLVFTSIYSLSETLSLYKIEYDDETMSTH